MTNIPIPPGAAAPGNGSETATPTNGEDLSFRGADEAPVDMSEEREQDYLAHINVNEEAVVLRRVYSAVDVAVRKSSTKAGGCCVVYVVVRYGSMPTKGLWC